ncbi:MAG: hypothetical protein AUI14_20250 [Actinobacteria bacterium 13_2_20CM_2_71_6]|nr:MAG: hypothetical protein AUI14_20250 [Actinobacteria bacterium 13_2_20CM_2_71_6]
MVYAAGALALMSTLLTASPAAAVPSLGSVPDAGHLSVDPLMRHLRALQAATDRGGGVRAPGTAGFTNSAGYVESVLTAAGYQVREHHFTFNYTQVLAARVRVLPDGGDEQIQVINYTPSTPVGGIQAPLAAVPVDATTGCEATDYAGSDYSGRIALIRRGGCSFTVKQRAAAAAGAIAVIIYNNQPGKVYGSLLGPTDGVVPVGAVTQELGERLVAAGPVRLELEVRQVIQTRETFNILADTRRGDPNDVLVVGAHLDTIPESPGINDNATGVAAVLTLAQLASHAPVPRKLRFAFWSAEEWGQVGSGAYLSTLDAAGLAQISGYVDLAKLGSPNYIRGVFDSADVDGSGGVTGPAGSATIENALIQGFALQRLSWKPVDLGGLANSDWLSFLSAGVPISGLFSGTEDLKTASEAALFGGVAGVAYDTCHALLCDRIDNVNRQVLEQNLRAVAFGLVVLETAPCAGGQRARAPGASRTPAGPFGRLA